MANTFFVGDFHYMHKNIMKFCPTTRKGKDVEDMSEMLVRNYQSVVQQEDTVYFLGDISFIDRDRTKLMLERLPGHKIFVTGNHDKGILGTDIRHKFELVTPYLEHKIEGVEVIMFHYPIVEWNKIHYGSYHCYGHVHGKDVGLNDRRALDVGIDNRPGGDMMPWSWDEVNRILSKRPIAQHH